MSYDVVMLANNEISTFATADENEFIMLKKAAELIGLEYPEHALLEVWNSSIHNLRRRIEAFSIDIFLSSISSLSGRKTYKKDGDSLSERWAGIDDEVLINGAVQAGVLNKKAGKALEMINWMRNHASPAHDSDECVTKEDVFGLVAILKVNLFDCQLPDPAHSPVTLIEPIKLNSLTADQIELFKEQINAFSNKDIRTIFGYAVDVICSGKNPEYSNVLELFQTIWDKATDEQKSDMGMKIYKFNFDPSLDKSLDSGASERLYDILLKVQGIKFIPEITRAAIFRKLAKNLARAKDTAYGWALENSASLGLKQVGIGVPSSAFTEVYQEILCVWCGNYWGRSEAYSILNEFIFSVSAKQKVSIAKLFMNNERVRSELHQVKPNYYALSLLSDIKKDLTNESQKSEIDVIMDNIRRMAQ